MAQERSEASAKQELTLAESGVIWVILSIFVVVLDQLTKYWVSSVFAYGQVMEVLPVFNVTLVHNFGAAFSLLSQAGGWQRWFFVVLAIAVSVVILVWLRYSQRSQKTFCAGVALILGGAIGNVLDRVLYGYVIDFLDFHWSGSHFPAFNVADSAITVGVILTLWFSFFIEPKQNQQS